MERKALDLLDKERELHAEMRKRLEEKAGHVRELRDILTDSVTALAETVEIRDPYTSGHQHRVANLAVAIGREFDLAEEDLTGLKIAATVHDIGKMRVPVEILSKPGRLDDEEMALIKLHPRAVSRPSKAPAYRGPSPESLSSITSGRMAAAIPTGCGTRKSCWPPGSSRLPM